MTQDKDQGAFEAQRPTGLLDDPYTRRRFLRGAVVGAAGVAGAAGIAGVVLTRGTPRVLAVASGTDPCSMCFEDTTFGQIGNEFNVHAGHASPGDFYLWFTATDLTPGATYSLSISPDPGDSPFKYTAQSNSIQLFQLTTNPASCPSGLPNGGTFDDAGQSISDVSPFTMGSGKVAVQVAFHIKWDGAAFTGDHTYTFNATLKSGSATICTSSITVTAHGDAEA